MRSGRTDHDGSGEIRHEISVEDLDLADPGARVHFARDAAALMNGGGGRVVVGIGRGGREVGITDEAAGALTAPKVAAAIDPFIAPDPAVVHIERWTVDEGRSIVDIDIARPDDLPVVLTAAGLITAADGVDEELFPAGSIVVRDGSRTRAAGRDDFRQWTAEAVERERARLAEQLAMVLHSPAGSRLRLLTDDEVLDDPSYFLTRSAELFRQRRERVLQTSDLQYLWLHRSALTPDRSASELLVQSALRKRATLFLWLTVLDLSPAALKAQLWVALDMRDRDKSDAARSILQVASLVAADDDYAELQQALATSDYAHMRSAAELWPTLADARKSLAATADRSLRTRSDAELLALADEIVSAGGSAVLRQAPPVGLEAFTRKLERSVRA